MENTVEEKGLQLDDLKVSNLPELQGWKEKQEKLVADNPYVEIIDNKTYDIACKSRTALLKGRTELEKQDKLVASKLASFRKDVKTETDNLIFITLPFEEKQQVEVKRYEGIKEEERLEKERIERERIEKIKTKIDLFESDSYRIIQETNIENVEMHKTMLNAFVNDGFDYEEYDILFEQAKMRIQASWDAKCNDIQEKEEQRLRNLELEKENEGLRNENLERENKAKADKEKIFEIRKNRLDEVGASYDYDVILNSDALEFETIFTNIKLQIQQAQSDAEASEKQKAIDLELSKADTEHLKKENKARVKRLANDKEIGINQINGMRFPQLVLMWDNQEIANFMNEAVIKFETLKSELLTELEKL